MSSTGGAPSASASPCAPAYGTPVDHEAGARPGADDDEQEGRDPDARPRSGPRRAPPRGRPTRRRRTARRSRPRCRARASRPCRRSRAVRRGRRARRARSRPAAVRLRARRRVPRNRRGPPARRVRGGSAIWRRSTTAPDDVSTTPAAIFVPPTSIPTARLTRFGPPLPSLYSLVSAAGGGPRHPRREREQAPAGSARPRRLHAARRRHGRRVRGEAGDDDHADDVVVRQPGSGPRAGAQAADARTSRRAIPASRSTSSSRTSTASSARCRARSPRAAAPT